MRCPACASELSQVKQSGLLVDVCVNGCGGIWFDNRELQKVDEAHESAGEALLGMSPPTPVPVDRTAKRHCPRCPDVTMLRHFVSVRKEIAVDECANCGGMWLDVGELAAMRAEFPTEAASNRAAKEYFSELFRGQLQKAAGTPKADLERARKIANAFRFICPSYWIPGKQDGSAF